MHYGESIKAIANEVRLFLGKLMPIDITVHIPQWQCQIEQWWNRMLAFLLAMS